MGRIHKNLCLKYTFSQLSPLLLGENPAVIKQLLSCFSCQQDTHLQSDQWDQTIAPLCTQCTILSKYDKHVQISELSPSKDYIETEL